MSTATYNDGLSEPGQSVRRESPSVFRNETAPARLLVVDDQEANIQILGAVLGKLGYEIIPAINGAAALKRVALRPPDLILLDLLMPGMDGFAVCGLLKENPDWRDIPIIFLSAADDKELIVRALEAGGVDYITKPFNQAELVMRVRTQIALKNARDHLRQLAEDKDELLGILAHDLKNSLGGINLSADLLHGKIAALNDARLTQLAANILRTSGQSLAFVREFLANVKADHSFRIQPAAVDLVAVTAAAVEHYQEAAQRKYMEIQTDFPAAPVVALADAAAVNQILGNLLSNALKFSPVGKLVFVTVKSTDRHAECVIRDEGPGFTAEDRQRMFRRYERLSARPTGGEPSSGLGLSIVRKLVSAMAGELGCENAAEGGAKFTVRLPRRIPD
jgi:two-component system sensor histidine kinase/response regulator